MSAEPLELVQDAGPKWAAAFVAAQAEMPAIEKKRTANTGSYSYSYADLGDIITAVRPVLAKHELAVSQDVQVKDGRVLCYTMIVHSSGESKTFGPIDFPSGPNPQTAGSAITYAKRYGESAALNLATEEDDDAQQASKTPTKASSRRAQTQAPSLQGDTEAGPPKPSGKAADGQAEATASSARNQGAKTPGEEAIVSSDGPSPPLTLREALEKRYPGRLIIQTQRERQICKDHKVNTIEELELDTLNAITAQVLSEAS